MTKINKSFRQSLIAIALGTIGMGCIAVSASETEQRHVMIKIDKTGDQNAMVDLNVDGVDEVFPMPDLEDGESRTITTESGKTIEISKTENGITLKIDGKNIDLPSVSGNLAAHIQRSMPLHQDIENGVSINGVELDENQKQIIRDAFLAAGIDKKINFSRNNMMIFSTDEGTDVIGNKFIIKKGSHDFEWSSEENSEIQVNIDSDSDSKVQIHTIHIEEKDED